MPSTENQRLYPQDFPGVAATGRAGVLQRGGGGGGALINACLICLSSTAVSGGYRPFTCSTRVSTAGLYYFEVNFGAFWRKKCPHDSKRLKRALRTSGGSKPRLHLTPKKNRHRHGHLCTPYVCGWISRRKYNIGMRKCWFAENHEAGTVSTPTKMGIPGSRL